MMDGFYKLIQPVGGGCSAMINRRLISFEAGEVVFLSPGDETEWVFRSPITLHVCQIRPEYFNDRPYLTRLFGEHPIFNHYKGLKFLSYTQALAISMLFRIMQQEENSFHEDKKEAILIYLQMLLLLVGRHQRAVWQQFSTPCHQPGFIN
jgi:hypothetical protein